MSSAVPFDVPGPQVANEIDIQRRARHAEHRARDRSSDAIGDPERFERGDDRLDGGYDVGVHRLDRQAASDPSRKIRAVVEFGPTQEQFRVGRLGHAFAQCPPRKVDDRTAERAHDRAAALRFSAAQELELNSHRGWVRIASERHPRGNGTAVVDRPQRDRETTSIATVIQPRPFAPPPARVPRFPSSLERYQSCPSSARIHSKIGPIGFPSQVFWSCHQRENRGALARTMMPRPA